MEWRAPALQRAWKSANHVDRLVSTSSARYLSFSVSPEVLHNIWKPDIFFSNEKQANFHSITAENKLLRIDHEGLILIWKLQFSSESCFYFYRIYGDKFNKSNQRQLPSKLYLRRCLRFDATLSYPCMPHAIGAFSNGCPGSLIELIKMLIFLGLQYPNRIVRVRHERSVLYMVVVSSRR